MKKYVTIILVVFVIWGLVGCNNRGMNYNIENESSEIGIATELHGTAMREGNYTKISMDEAVAMMEEKTDYIILDVRTEEEFAEKHIPNAINIPNETIGDDPIWELPREDQLILVYCRSGNRSKQASEKLAALGYTNVYEFGGIIDWDGELITE